MALVCIQRITGSTPGGVTIILIMCTIQEHDLEIEVEILERKLEYIAKFWILFMKINTIFPEY
jgi:hypothetical protein